MEFRDLRRINFQRVGVLGADYRKLISERMEYQTSIIYFLDGSFKRNTISEGMRC